MTNEQKAYLDGLWAALDMLKEEEKRYFITKTDRLPQKLAKENILIALRKFGDDLQDTIAAKEQEEPEEPAGEPAKKKAKKTKE